MLDINQDDQLSVSSLSKSLGAKGEGVTATSGVPLTLFAR